MEWNLNTCKADTLLQVKPCEAFPSIAAITKNNSAQFLAALLRLMVQRLMIDLQNFTPYYNRTPIARKNLCPSISHGTLQCQKNNDRRPQ